MNFQIATIWQISSSNLIIKYIYEAYFSKYIMIILLLSTAVIRLIFLMFMAELTITISNKFNT